MKKRRIIIIMSVAMIVFACLVVTVIASRRIINSLGPGVVGMPDQIFGDQHFKTTISLIEIHHLRHGVFPAELSDLEYLGYWDVLPLSSVQYFVSPAGDAYCFTVTRGWVGKPDLTYPPEFFNGTGFDSTLCP